MALLKTHIAAATASLVWMFIEWRRFGRPSLVGIVTGMVAGLATVTPASGFIGVPGGLILGSFLVAFLALSIFGELGPAGGISAGAQCMVQLKSVAITLAWTAVASVFILMIVRMFVGLRVDAEVEVEGLDLSEHGERGNHTS